MDFLVLSYKAQNEASTFLQGRKDRPSLQAFPEAIDGRIHQRYNTHPMLKTGYRRQFLAVTPLIVLVNVFPAHMITCQKSPQETSMKSTFKKNGV